MINTYTTSLPPPVPPRLGVRGHAPVRTAPLIWFLAVAMVLHMLGSLGGFVYLFRRSDKLQGEFQERYLEDLLVLRRLQECDDSSLDQDTLLDCKKVLSKYKSIILKISQAEGRADLRSVPSRDSGAMAHLLVQPWLSQLPFAKTLRWNQAHSLLVNVDYVPSAGALKVRTTGNYYVYSQVAFSKSHPKTPLVQSIVSSSASGDRTQMDVLLRAFCNVRSEGGVCTSFQGGVFKLEKDVQLFVNVTDTSLLNYEEIVTTFGLFML